MTDNAHTPGQWAVFRSPGFGGFDMFGAAQIERVTAKTIYAKANHRTQFSPGQVVAMPDEAAARLVVERINSAIAEANERTSRARDAADQKIVAILAKAGAA